MSVGSKAGSKLTVRYTLLRKGTKLWHVYPARFDALAFNPVSLNRFAAQPPPPDCEMYYAGDSSACAVWEVVLRNLVVDEDDKKPQHIDPKLIEGRSIVEVELTEDLKILDLRSPKHRRLSSDPARHSEWQQLMIEPEARYSETHAEAKRLRAAAPEMAGLRWNSRQISTQSAFVFYRPPHLAGSFRVVKSHELDTPEGWTLIDAALDVVGVKRLGATALAAELADDLPPEDIE
jgi:hypothetical protein